jgi:TPR repeat protein
MVPEGWGVKRDPRQAARWYLKAAKQGDTIARYEVTRLYELGSGVIRSHSKAVGWYRKAKSGIDMAVGHTADAGRALVLEYGQQGNLHMEAEWLGICAEAGNSWCRHTLARDYRSGSAAFPQNFAKAMVWYWVLVDQRVGEPDYEKPSSEYEIGQMYAIGQGVAQSYQQIALAGLYVNGQGVAQSDRLALIWYFKVAASSSYSATVEQRQRAREQFFAVFEKANGVPVVHREAVEWYRDRASKGDAFARRELALSYELGYRVGQNHLVALAIDTLLTHDPAAPEDEVIHELIPKNHEYRPRDFDRLLNTISQPGQFLGAIDEFIAHPPPHIIMWAD